MSSGIIRSLDVDKSSCVPCKMCNRSFVPSKRGVKFCSLECSRRYHKIKWSEKRSKLRARKRKNINKICPNCGTMFVCDSILHNKIFCSSRCKRQHEIITRRANGERRDSCLITFDDTILPVELNDLRDDKSRDYFKKLFSLDKGKQFAEMSAWTPDDHRKAYEYFGLIDSANDFDFESEITIEEKTNHSIEDEDNPVLDI